MKRVYLVELNMDKDDDESLLILEKQLKEIDPSMQFRQTIHKSLEDYDYQHELDHYYAAGYGAYRKNET